MTEIDRITKMPVEITTEEFYAADWKEAFSTESGDPVFEAGIYRDGKWITVQRWPDVRVSESEFA